MSDEQTSPEPTESAESGEVASVESPELSGSETEPSEPVETAADSIETAKETIQEDDFNIDSWDGNIASLPQHLQGPVTTIQKNLEGGYTKKFQMLADQRKKFDVDQEAWNTQKTEWEATKDDLVAERDLLKQMLDGGEDPRLSEYTTKFETSQAELSEMRAEYEKFKALVEEDIDAQAVDFAEKFYEEHKAILEKPENAEILNSLLDEQWNPEQAIKLIHLPEEGLQLAKDLHKKGTPQDIAVEHTLMKFGQKKRAPRPGAKLTAGAESSNNPASSRGYTDFGTTAQDARFAAAQAAVNFAKRNS